MVLVYQCTLSFLSGVVLAKVRKSLSTFSNSLISFPLQKTKITQKLFYTIRKTENKAQLLTTPNYSDTGKNLFQLSLRNFNLKFVTW
jgi:hypothetical protein